MIQLGAQAYIEDYLLEHGMPMGAVEDRIKSNLTRSLAEELMKQKEFHEAVVKRDANARRIEWIAPGRTEYELRLWLLTPEEAKEYRELKKFKEDMQRFVR